MKGLYRGFCRNENGTETIVLNGEKIKGKWVQGFLATEYHIIDNTDSFTYFGCGGMDGVAKFVIPETVCEAVRGLTDRDGKQVFEGDVLKYTTGGGGFGYIEVEYSEKYAVYFPYGSDDMALESDEAEVVGTIFDEQFAEGV
jgi:hypothetical protein